MIRKLCNWLLYDLLGWKTHVTVEHPKKFIICLAPHTSNWDFLIGLLYMYASGMRINFLMKKEWFFWPLGPIFRCVGGIPVHRAKHTSMTDSLAEIASKQEEFKLCVTPEGTRSLNPDWKKRILFYRSQSACPRAVIRRGLWAETHRMYQKFHSDRRFWARDETDQTVF